MPDAPTITADEIPDMIQSPEFAAMPAPQRQDLAESALGEATKHLAGTWTPETFSAYGDFAKAVRAHVAGLNGLNDNPYLQLGNHGGEDAGKVLSGSLPDMGRELGRSLVAGVGDLSFIDPTTGQWRWPGQNIAAGLNTNLQKAADTLQVKGSKLLGDQKPVNDAIDGLKSEIDAGNLPFNDEDQLGTWLDQKAAALSPVQAAWYDKAQGPGWNPGYAVSNGLQHPHNAALLSSYLKTRNPAVWDQLKDNLLKTPQRAGMEATEQDRLAQDPMTGFLTQQFGKPYAEAMKGAGDPINLAGVVLPALKGVEAAGATGKLAAAGHLAKGAGEAVALGNLGLSVQDPNATWQQHIDTSKQMLALGLGLGGGSMLLGKTLQGRGAPDGAPATVPDAEAPPAAEPAAKAAVEPVAPAPAPVAPTFGDADYSPWQSADPEIIARNTQVQEGRDVPPYQGNTSIRNAVVDQERAARGLPPLMAPAAREWGSAWDEASKKLDGEPDAGQKLVEELNNQPRSLSDTENALLLQHKLTVQDKIRKAVDVLNDPNADEATQGSARLALSQHNAAHNAVDEAGKAAGTHMGRGLNARKMWGGEEDFYSLPSMLAREQAMKGEPLTPAEMNDVQSRNAKLTEARNAVEVHADKVETQQAQEGATRLHQDLVKDITTGLAEVPQEAQYETAKELERQRAAAFDRIRQRREAAAGRAGREALAQSPEAAQVGTQFQGKPDGNSKPPVISPHPLGRGNYDVLDFLNEHPLQKPQGSSAGEYDGLRSEDLPSYWSKYLFDRAGNGLAPDNAAQAAHEAGVIKAPTTTALAEEVQQAIQNRQQYRAQIIKGKQSERSSVQQHKAFEKARTSGDQRVPVSHLEMGDKLLLDGHPLEVTGIEYDPGGDVERVQVKDGPKYGVQSIAGDAVLMVDDFRKAEHAPQSEDPTAPGWVAEPTVSPGVMGFLKTAAEKAEARHQARLRSGQVSFLPVQDLADAAIVAAYHIANGAVKFADFSREMIKDFGTEVSDHLQELFKAGKQHLDDTTKTVTERVRQSKLPPAPEKVLNEHAQTGKVTRQTIIDMARAHLGAGAKDLPELLDRVHADVRRIDPAMTRRQVQDILPNYGKVIQPSKNLLERQLSEMKTQARLTSAYEDAAAGKPPKRTGFQRGKPSDIARELGRKVRDTMRRMGIETRSPEEQLASALDGVKSRLRNQIADIQKQLDTGERAPKRQGIAYDTEAKALQGRRDALREQLHALDSPLGLTAAQRLKTAMSATQRSIDEYNRRIKERDFTPRPKGEPLPDTARLNELRKARDEAKDTYEHLKDLDPSAKLEAQKVALNQLKRRLATNQRNLQAKLDTGDFSKRKPAEIKYDDEAERLGAKYEQTKLNYKRAVAVKELADRPFQRKVGDTLVKWQRGFLLSGLGTMGKLGMAAMYRLAGTPLEEVGNTVWSHLLPDVAAKAERNTGLNLRAEAKALTEGFVKGVRQFGQVATGGKSDLDLKFGKIKASDLDHSMLDYFGQLHAAIKNPIKQAEFSRSFEIRMRNAIDRGADGTQPVVQMRIAKEAYADANRAIFMQDSAVANLLNRAFGGAEKEKVNPTASYWMGKALRSLFPVVKVGVNYASESGNYIFGVPRGVMELGAAMKRGLDHLEPAQADAILRHFSKGSVGAGMMLLGFLNPQSVGGYYQPGEKRRPGDVAGGTYKLFGVTVPHLLAHAPILEAMQFGATMARVMNHMNDAGRAHRKGLTPENLTSAAWAASLGLLRETPLLRGTSQIADAASGKENGGHILRQYGKGFIVPQGVSDIARFLDPAPGRKVTTFGQEVQSGIPLMRNQLPVKPKH